MTEYFNFNGKPSKWKGRLRAMAMQIRKGHIFKLTLDCGETEKGKWSLTYHFLERDIDENSSKTTIKSYELGTLILKNDENQSYHPYVYMYSHLLNDVLLHFDMPGKETVMELE